MSAMIVGVALVAALTVAAVPVLAQPQVKFRYTCDYQGVPGSVDLGGMTAGLVNVNCNLPGFPGMTVPVALRFGKYTVIGSLAEGTARDTVAYRDGSFSSQLRVSRFSGFVIGPNGPVGPYVNVDMNVQISYPAGTLGENPMPNPLVDVPDRVHIVFTGKTDLPKNFLVNNR